MKREKPESTRRNRRPGRNEELLKAVECRSGELVMGCDALDAGSSKFFVERGVEWRMKACIL